MDIAWKRLKLAAWAGQSGRMIVSMALSGLVLAVLSQPAGAATLYRYINEKGYQEIGYSIPPRLVPNGYDVIDESGRLIRRVAAQLSEEEYAAKLERELKLEKCQKALDRVNRRYEALTDIDAAELQFEKQLEESLQNYQANLEYGKTSLGEQQQRAANLERAGKVIPKDLLDNIQRLEVQIQNITAKIVADQRSRHTKAEEFNEERRVFSEGSCNAEQLASNR